MSGHCLVWAANVCYTFNIPISHRSNVPRPDQLCSVWADQGFPAPFCCPLPNVPRPVLSRSHSSHSSTPLHQITHYHIKHRINSYHTSCVQPNTSLHQLKFFVKSLPVAFSRISTRPQLSLHPILH